jgi:type I restriction enzyme S subunit
VSALPVKTLGDFLGRVETWNPLRAKAGDVFRYIDLSSVDQGTKAIADARATTCGEAPSRARQLVATGDVLVSTVRPNLNGVARVPNELNGATASTGFCVLRPDPEKLDGGYLFQWVKSPAFVGGMVRKATGASYPAVSDRIIFESSFPLPLLPEQRRIAAILDQAETLRTQRRAALAQLDNLTQSIFLDMFGNPVSNSKDWDTDALQNVCSSINDCPHTTPEWTESGLICLRTSNLTEGGWQWGDTRFVSESTFHERSRRGYLQAGDIVLSREGTVGIAAIVEVGMQLCMGQRLVQVSPTPGILVAEYLLRHLLYVLAPLRISQQMVGSTSQHLNVKELRALRIPLPPLPLQKIFATRTQAIEALKEKHRVALAELDALFASLQHRAFNGELTTQAPTQPKRRSFAELGQLDAGKGLEALVYAAHRLPDKGHYWPLKAQYVADRRHLERHGRTLYGETHVAMPYGPVPQAAFNASRALAKGELICEFPMDAVRTALRRDGDALVALRDADTSVLGADERESLDWAIRLVTDMSFDELKTQTHDAAWKKTVLNEPMAWQDIIATLAPAAQQRLLATFEQGPPQG